MCKVLKATRSGYYAYEQKLNKKQHCTKVKLVVLVRSIHLKSRETYGTRRMSKALNLEGYNIGRYQARSLMREANVDCKQRRRYKQTTNSKHNYPISENKLNRQFEVVAPNAVWVGDITYIRTVEGWLYLAVVIDLYSRKVVGWSINNTMTSELVSNALKMSIGRRQSTKELMYHSDRGSQYASDYYQTLLRGYGIVCSMSRKGNCWDNAVAERFFGSLKTECIDNKIYTTRKEAKDEIVDYIEVFYNNYRLHSTLGYMSPANYEQSNQKFF